MNPLQFASLLNATFAAVDRAVMGGGGSDPTAFVAPWSLADPATCVVATQSGDFPTVGTACTPGQVAWSVSEYCNDVAEWLLYCPSDTSQWAPPTNIQTMTDYTTDDVPKFWIRVTSDRDDPTPAWELGTVAGNAEINARCATPTDSPWRNAGSLQICLGSMQNQGLMAAVICDGDNPTCAASQYLNQEVAESADCP